LYIIYTLLRFQGFFVQDNIFNNMQKKPKILMKIDIICIGIEHPGNLGAITRSMKNFGFERLVLVDPRCDVKEGEAIARSKHAKDILVKAKVKGIDALDGYDILVGTTSVIGTDYNIPRSPIKPDDLTKKLIGTGNRRKLGIVFGPESTGLSNEVIKKMDMIVTIPTSKVYPALNLSHSVAIILYELSKESKEAKTGDNIIPCTRRHKDEILKRIDESFVLLDFPSELKEETQRRAWKRTIGKSMITKREAFALLGYFKRMIDVLKRCRR